MANNARGTIDITVDTFGGLSLETGAPDTPLGLASDCQDVEFQPGSVKARACLRKLLFPAIPGLPSVTYTESYTQPDETTINLILDSAGSLWRENVETTPGQRTLIKQVVAASYANSVSAFGRKYIALNDGKHGTDVPYQYDGTNLDRVSQDGPGNASIATETDNTGVVINTVTPLRAPAATSTVANAGPGDHIYRVTYGSGAELLRVGDQIQFTGSANPAFDGTFTIAAKDPSPSTELYYDRGAYIGLFSLTNVQSGLTVVVTATPYGAITTTATLAGVTNPAYDGTWPVRRLDDPVTLVIVVSPPGLAASVGGTLAVTGMVDAGLHKCVVSFLTRNGFITKPGPVATWIATGAHAVTVSNLPIGPANVIARIVAFTGAGGGNFFQILANIIVPDPTGGPSTVIQSTIVPDNTSTSATFNFSDNILFGANGIDIPGNNLFALRTLGPCLGFFQYAGRLFPWGERNQVFNFLNMTFDGGYMPSQPFIPSGWSQLTTGGGLFNGGAWLAGQAWLITGDGTANELGKITQSAYQDPLGIPILLPNTRYSFRVWLSSSGTRTGFIGVRLNSATAGVLASGSISLSQTGTIGAFYEVELDTDTPAVIPADAMLEIYAKNQTNGDVVIVDENELIYTHNPFTDTLFRGSYVLNPESFDGVTGVLGALGDPSPIRAPFELRNNFYFNTAARLQVTADNGTGEPSTWRTEEVEKVGALSSRASAPSAEGEDWQFIASRGGVYIFSGSTPIKISQEIQQSDAGILGWEDINFDSQEVIWMVNDSVRRKLYVAVPLTNTEAPPWTAPSVLFVLDYRYLETADAIAGASPLRNDGRGGLTTFDLGRKWTRWNLFLDCGTIQNRSANDSTFVVGSGNGVTPGNSPSFGEIYRFDSTKRTDDDYGQIGPFYTTAFMVSNAAAQATGVGVHRQQAAYLTMFITGIGTVVITPYPNTLQNAWNPTPNIPLSMTRSFDSEIGLNVLGERIAYRFDFIPVEGTTDVFFNLSQLCVSYRPDPWSPVRGAY